MIILIVIVFWKCKSPLEPALIQKPGVTQGLQNWFLSPKAVSCQPIVYRQLMILGKRSYNLLQSEPGREQRDGWAARKVRQRGSAPAVQAVSGRGTWKVPGCVSFNASGSIVCAASLPAEEFCGNFGALSISFWLFFFPLQRWWWSWIARVSAGAPAFRFSLPFASL